MAAPGLDSRWSRTILRCLAREPSRRFQSALDAFETRHINSGETDVADVRDEHSMKYLVKSHEMFFNLAGQTSHLDSMSDPYTDLDINCRAQLSILESCRRNNRDIRIVYASTRQIYGRPEYVPVDERHLLQPTDVNGINKMAGEWYHILYSRVHGVRACALRLTNTYGPRQLVRSDRVLGREHDDAVVHDDLLG